MLTNREMRTQKVLAKAKKRAKDRERNFRRMSPSGKRVAVAKDVLGLIAANKFRAEHCGYLSGAFIGKADSIKRTSIKTARKTDARDLYLEVHDIVEQPVGYACTGCALGSMMLATLLRVDDLSADKLVLDTTLNSQQMVRYLKKFFPFEQLALIERAYEGTQVGGIDRSAGRDQTSIAAAVFGAHYRNPTERVEAIMRNIIAHDGTFVPPAITRAQQTAAWRGKYDHLTTTSCFDPLPEETV